MSAIRHDFDWTKAPAPWNRIGPEIAASMRVVIGGGPEPRRRRANAAVCRNGHLLTPENTLYTSNGGRRCRQCEREYNTQYVRERRDRERAAAE